MALEQGQKFPDSSEPAPKAQMEFFDSEINAEAEIQALKQAFGEKVASLTTEELEGFRAYLATLPKWKEVYRRLADS